MVVCVLFVVFLLLLWIIFGLVYVDMWLMLWMFVMVLFVICLLRLLLKFGSGLMIVVVFFFVV